MSVEFSNGRCSTWSPLYSPTLAPNYAGFEISVPNRTLFTDVSILGLRTYLKSVTVSGVCCLISSPYFSTENSPVPA